MGRRGLWVDATVLAALLLDTTPALSSVTRLHSPRRSSLQRARRLKRIPLVRTICNLRPETVHSCPFLNERRLTLKPTNFTSVNARPPPRPSASPRSALLVQHHPACSAHPPSDSCPRRPLCDGHVLLQPRSSLAVNTTRSTEPRPPTTVSCRR